MTSRAAQRAEQEQQALKGQQERYLRALRQIGTLTAGCKAAKVSPHTVYAWREMDTAFTVAEHEARESFADELEQGMVRRAWHWLKKPVYQQGALVGHIQEFSDTLLIFALKAIRPDKYREHARLEHSGPDGGPIVYEDRLGHLSDAELRRLAAG